MDPVWLGGKTNPRDLYEIKHIKGHGSGLVAKRDISRGTRILAEAPIMQIYMKSPSSIVEQVQTHFDRLAQDDKRSCESLHCVDFERVVPQAEKEVLTFKHFASEKERETVYRLIAVFYTNQFSLDFLSPHTSGLFAKISRINHSCIPNTQWSYNQKLGRLTIHANRDITAGTEITITYKPTDTQTYEQRKRDLLVYGFECDCEACNDRETSDGRRARMADLDDKIAKYMDGAPTNDEYRCALEMVEEFVDLYSKEQLAGREFEARCRQAAKINIELGDLPKAVEWAEKMVDSMLANLGPENREYKQASGYLARLEQRARLRPLLKEVLASSD